MSSKYSALVEKVRNTVSAKKKGPERYTFTPPKGPLLPVFSMFDGVDLYQKNGLVEVYGASLRQHKSGPIRVSHSALQITHDQAHVFWSPDYGSSEGATHIAVEFHRKPDAGRITAGLITRSGSTYVFTGKAGPDRSPPKPPPLLPLVPEELASAISRQTSWRELTPHEKGFVAELPAHLVAKIAGEDPVRTFFVVVEHAAGTTLEFRTLALARAADSPPKTVTIAGQVTGAALPPGSTLILVNEKNERIEQQLSLDNHFRFDGIPAGTPVSLRFSHEKQDYFATLGRWFVPTSDRHDLRVDLAPLYTNPDGHAADPAKAKFITPRTPIPVPAYYEPHARQFWPGYGVPQDYESTTFSNNMGFIDRDRFFDNPDGCYRVVHLGSSHAVALQVRPFEKYNIVMESELGLKLQRCVEVISAGRDNGDIGSNYPRVRDYAARFRPDVILLENCNALVMQLHPVMLKRGFGWDHEFNALDNFYYDDKGALNFRPWTPDYPIHTSKPDPVELTKGVPLFKTLQIPLRDTHQMGREAFKYLGDILSYFKEHHPEHRLVVHTGLDEAQCRDSCNNTVKLPSGKIVPMGARTFIENHKRVCEARGLECLFPDYPNGYGTPQTYLTFVSDGHYSVRGHQWLARELTRGLADKR